jgi:inner membrane protein
MDPITHTLTGVILSRAGLNRLAPDMAPLAVAASVWPDIDVVTMLASDTLYLEVHRGWTHALAMQPLQAFLLTLLWRWWAGRHGPVSKGAWLRAGLSAWFCLTLHVFFDTWNVYGVRPFAPFSWVWVHFDWLHVFDLWVWAILVIGLLAPMLARLVYTEIGARGGSGVGAAWLALFLFAGYLTGRAILHDRAVAQINARLFEGETPRQIFAVPGPGNPFDWKGVVETASAWHVVDTPLLREFDPEEAQTFYKPESARLIGIAKATRTGQVFVDFSKATAWRVTPAGRIEGGTEIRATDLRFGLPSEGQFSAEWTIAPDGQVLSETYSFRLKQSGT